MMNKKRLAALAMSAVMAAGTVSIPVNASAFSDGTDAVAQEATEVTDFGSDATTQSAEVEVAEDVAAVPVIEKIEFTAEDGRWGELQDTTYTLTLSAAGKDPMGAVYRNTDGKYEAVMVDVVKQGDNILVVSMEKFAGYVLVYGLPASN